MLHLHRCVQLSDLTGCLVANIAAGKLGPFEQTVLVVPNRNVETHLRFEIARRTGIAANLRFDFLERFLDGLIPKSIDRVRILHRGVLHHLLLGLLGDEGKRWGPLPGEVETYLAAGGGDADARQLRRFQLAGQLARLFENYTLCRGEMVAAWGNDRPTIDTPPFADVERWQRVLWHRVFAAGGVLEHLEETTSVRWLRQTELADRLDVEELRLPPRAHLFGFSYLARALQRLLARLAARAEIHAYLFLPCLEFHEDFEQSGIPITPERPLPSLEERFDNEPELVGDDPFELNAPEEMPAVRLWARPGRESLRLLGRLPDVRLDPAVKPATPPPRTLLGRFQQDVIRREVVPAGGSAAASLQADESLRVLACPSIQREVEVIGNEIWSLVRQDEAAGNRPEGGQSRLRFHEIAVIVANREQLPIYQTHLRSVFSELYHIPYNMADVELARQSRLVEGVELLLRLPLGRFTRPELLGLLTHPAMLAQWPDADPDQWHAWCDELGIVHGADRQDHDGTYIHKDLFNWDQGLRRLALGAWMTGARSGDQRQFPWGGQSYLPQQVPDSAQPSAALLIQLVRSLIADARFARDAEMTLSEWSVFLGRLVTSYFGGQTDQAERDLARCLRQIHALRELDVDGRKVSYRIASQFVVDGLQGMTGSWGQYLADGVVISSFTPMRSIPFRVVFIAGLGEGYFPAIDRPDLLDLTSARRVAGDVTPRERDAYLFLETLMAAGDKLRLSYVARDAKTGDELTPSSLVQQLLFILSRHYLDQTQIERLTVRHPLRRYDAKYFPSAGQAADAALPNFSPTARQEAAARRLRETLPAAAGGQPLFDPRRLAAADPRLSEWLGMEPLPGIAPAEGQQPQPAVTAVASEQSRAPETVSISLAQVRKFLECPLQGWARVMLNLREEDDEDLVAREDEPFAAPRLQQAVLLRNIFGRPLASKEFLAELAGDEQLRAVNEQFEQLYAAKADYFERKGAMPTEIFLEADRRRHLAILRNWTAQLRALGLAAHGPFQVLRFGRAEEHEDVDRLLDPIVLEVDLPQSDGEPQRVRVELHGQTQPANPEEAVSLVPLAKKTFSLKDHLRGFVDCLALTAAGWSGGVAYQSCLLCDEAPKARSRKKVEPRRVFCPIEQADARAYLTGLLTEMLADTHAYLLPFEAVEKLVDPACVQTIEQIVDNLKANPFVRYSSQYGPVPRPERFDPPSAEETRAMIDRRFGWFLQSSDPPGDRP